MSEATGDGYAGRLAGSPLAELRRQRPDVVQHLQGSDDAIFAPADRRRLHPRRARSGGAARSPSCCATARWKSTTGRRLAALGETAARSDGARGDAVLAHVDLRHHEPRRRDARPTSTRLLAAGLSPHAVVSLSQLIAYVNFQSRVLAGLRMLQGCTHEKPMRDFTHGELEWLPWITPVDLDAGDARRNSPR